MTREAREQGSAVPFRNADLASHVPTFTSIRMSIRACRCVLVLHDQEVPLPLGMRVMRREHGPGRSGILVSAVRDAHEPVQDLVLLHVVRVDVDGEDAAVGPDGVEEGRRSPPRGPTSRRCSARPG